MFKRLLKLNSLSLGDRLSRAISEFESRLPDEARAEFQKLRLYTRQNSPSDRDVYRLTTELDRIIATDGLHTRAYGPCLISLLQSVQQFAALDEDIDGSSRTFDTCDPWVVVEFSLRYIVRQRKTVHEITRILMAVGRSSPRYQSLTAYYVDSKELRRSLVEYFIVVVRLCHDSYKHTSKFIAHQTVYSISTITGSKFKESNSLAKSIQQEITMLNATDCRPVYEGGELSPDTSVAAQRRKTIRQCQENKNNVLKFLSTWDHQASWKHARKQITTEWFLQESVYQDWKEKVDSATLICDGKHGSGKSVMLANMVDDLRLVDHDSIVTYFFCTYDEPKSLEPFNILSSFARQLVEVLPVEVFAKETFNEPCPTFGSQDEHALLMFLKPYLSKARPTKAFFVLDGLHDCSENSRSCVLQCLRRLQMDFPLLLCISGIEDSSIHSRISLLTDISRLSAIINPLEMRKFIEREFNHREDFGVPIPEISKEIYDTAALSLLSETSYPFVRLCLLYLSVIKPDAQSLTELPKNPSDLLTQLIRYGNLNQGPLFQLLIELTVTAIEPLTLDQLQEAPSVSLDAKILDQENCWWTIRSILDYYDGFWTIDEERLTVHMAHRNVMELLSSDTTTKKVIDTSIAQQRMAEICLASLNRQYLPLCQKRSRACSAHATNSSTFQAYAAKYWLWHFVYIPAEDSTSIDLARKLLSRKGQELNHPGQPTQTLVQWAFTNNHNTLLTLAIQSGMHAEAHPLIISAACQNDLPSLKFLLSLFTFDLNALTIGGKPLLYFVAEASHTEIVSYLVRHGCTRVGGYDNARRSELWYAASTGNIARVKRILSTGVADVNAKDVYAMTPLATAVMHRHTEIVELLLADPGVDTRIQDDDFRTPLQTAKLYGFTKEADLLSEYEARVYGGHTKLK